MSADNLVLRLFPLPGERKEPGNEVGALIGPQKEVTIETRARRSISASGVRVVRQNIHSKAEITF